MSQQRIGDHCSPVCLHAVNICNTSRPFIRGPQYNILLVPARRRVQGKVVGQTTKQGQQRKIVAALYQKDGID
ncbi:hypothetical protein BDQ94DRAFT_145439 [Aspergillus welwitschiae]|uniref:Uncharacterized protein n=1 Tax=Aspergillus welwitschiae TaxID=1341132 RepID=A0A3F3Q0E7_9EURO|nr:hypothetical protein BDQ94DRAFT_145439 [Aspergillus welwitschiae]RDH32555.1 hypothetical protein BDQ94DRAFT_145439 [Aspergillus welwitschiae]